MSTATTKNDPKSEKSEKVSKEIEKELEVEVDTDDQPDTEDDSELEGRSRIKLPENVNFGPFASAEELAKNPILDIDGKVPMQDIKKDKEIVGEKNVYNRIKLSDGKQTVFFWARNVEQASRFFLKSKGWKFSNIDAGPRGRGASEDGITRFAKLLGFHDIDYINRNGDPATKSPMSQLPKETAAVFTWLKNLKDQFAANKSQEIARQYKFMLHEVCKMQTCIVKTGDVEKNVPIYQPLVDTLGSELK